MIDGKLLIEKLLVYAKKFLCLNELDVVYERTMLLHLFNLPWYYPFFMLKWINKFWGGEKWSLRNTALIVKKLR